MAMHELSVRRTVGWDAWEWWPCGRAKCGPRLEVAVLTDEHVACTEGEPRVLYGGIAYTPLDLLHAGLETHCGWVDGEHESPDALALCLAWRQWFLLTDMSARVRVRQHHFRRTWQKLARTGTCDRFWGAECQRVYGEWVAAGRPRNLAEFITESANRLSSDQREEGGENGTRN